MVFTGERTLIGNEFVEKDSHCPNVRTRIGMLAAN